jgi:putative N6-adenine-specific DNA methylase
LANPPYGVRLGDRHDAASTCRDLGDFLKRRCPGATAHVYFGDRRLLKQVGLRPASRRPLVNGALDGRLCRFDIFAGGWRESRQK